MDSKSHLKLLVIAATALCIGCSSANGHQAPAHYPEQVLGVWEAGPDTCRLPGNLDSDTRIEIKPNKLVDYEQWNEPDVVEQISTKPKAWKIKSRLYIDEYLVDQEEIYILTGSDDGALTIADQSRSATYKRCR